MKVLGLNGTLGYAFNETSDILKKKTTIWMTS